MNTDIFQFHFGIGDNVNGSKYEYHVHCDECKDKQLDLGTILQIKDNYCENAYKEYRCLPLIEADKIIDIEKIYVTIILSNENLSREKIVVDTSGVAFSNLIETVEVQRDLGSPQKVEANYTISIRNVLFSKKVLILGEPGIGKSTLLKKIFIDVCNKKIFVDLLPIYIPLSNVKIKEINSINHYLFSKYIELKSILSYYIESGHTFFMLDGVDEIDYSEQQLVSNYADQIAAKGNKVFLTCRTAVFPKGVFSSDFKIFECVGFNAAQRRKFLKLWFDDDLNRAMLIEKEIANNIGTAGISRNPLLLSLIAMNFEKNIKFKLPQKRIYIYLKSIQLLLERREEKNIWSIPIETRINLLEYIAYEMNIRNIDVIEVDLLRTIINEWKEHHIDSTINQYRIDDFMQLLDIDGVLYHCSKKQLRFLHLVLQECLAASYLSKQKDWFDIFKSKMYFPRWEETLRLLISLVTQNNIQNDMLADYLFDQKNDDRDNLFLIGRYISDFDSSNAKKFLNIFNDILSYLLSDSYQYNYTEAIVALASICNTHTNYRDYMFNCFKKDLQESYKSIYIYINLLKLIPSRASKREVLRLIHIFSSGNFKREVSIRIIGMLIDSLEWYYDFEFWKDIYIKYVNTTNSYLSGVIASTLSNIQMTEMYEFIKEEYEKGDSYINLLLSYIIQKYENEEYTRDLIITAIYKQEINIAQTFSEQYLLEDCGDILELIKHENSIIGQAILLDSGFSFSNEENSKFLENIIFDKRKALVLRCSALNKYLFENNSNKNRIGKVISYLWKNNNEMELQLVCIHSLEIQENEQIYDFFFDCGTNLKERVIYSLTRVLSANKVDDSIFFLQEILKKFEVGSTIHMYATLALARQDYPDINSYLMKYISRFPNINFREKVLIAKALSISSSKNKVGILLDYLKLETDRDIISLIIEKLGYVNEREVEQLLLQYLNVNSWPQAWPSPLSELEEGEQRPTDRRLIMIILSLNKLGSSRAIPLLKEIYNDITQTDDVRKTAYIVYKNLKWDSNKSIL